jgi:hypothetical protein
MRRGAPVKVLVGAVDDAIRVLARQDRMADSNARQWLRARSDRPTCVLASPRQLPCR